MGMSLEEKKLQATSGKLKKKNLRNAAETRIQKAVSEGNYFSDVPDYQRQLVYSAERLWQLENHDRITFEECKVICDDLLNSEWLIDKFGQQEEIGFKPGRGGNTAWAYSAERYILMPEPMRKLWILVHEMSHILAPMGIRHGKEFVQTYLFMVQNVFGKDSRENLEDCFCHYGVDF